MTEMELYLAEVKNIVRRNVENSTPQLISAEIEKYRRARNVSKKVSDQVRAAIKSEVAKLEAGFLIERVHVSEEEIIRKYEATESSISASVRETVNRAMRAGKTDAEIQVVLAGELKVAARHVGTIQNTTRAALSRVTTLDETVKSDSPFFRYAGRRYAARPFCKEHLDRVFHLMEINAMSNGQGLYPVIIYCGGYNCGHRWVGVSLDTARSERPEWFDERGIIKTNFQEK